jgi:thymidylate synthase
MNTKRERIPALYVTAESASDACYKALKIVHEEGAEIRTQYDRKDKEGSYIDPPGKDARVFIEIKDLFAEPRFPKICYSEWGKYIAEFLGAKDHLVVPYEKLLEMVKGDEKFEPTEWPYCYHQRLTAYPNPYGSPINQLEKAVERLVGDPVSRRAVAMTGFPPIDVFLKQDIPCLRELQFRVTEDKKGRWILHTFARWRSRDAFKAWPDNIAGVRNQLQFEVVPMLQKKSGREVVLGPYSEENGSLHIYGQDYTEKGMNNFFQVNPTLFKFLQDSMEKQETFDGLIIDQLKELKGEETWKFPPESIKLIDKLIESYESGKFKP